MDYCIGMLTFCVWAYMMQNHIAEKIRNSKIWFIGWGFGIILPLFWVPMILGLFDR